jgi:hypothetical protein
MAVVLSIWSLSALGAAVQGDSSSLELKSFKFKHAAGLENLFGHNEGEGRLFFYTNGTAEATFKVPAAGDFEVVIQAGCDAAQNERAKFKLAIDGKEVGKETLLTAEEPKEYKFSTRLTAGEHKLAIEFTNDAYKEGAFDRNLYVHAVTVKAGK